MVNPFISFSFLCGKLIKLFCLSFSQSEPTIASKITPETRSTNNSINNTNKIPTMCVKPLLSKSKTQISSVYTKLSSIKPQSANLITSNANKNSSIPNYTNCKSVKTTSIGNAVAVNATNYTNNTNNTNNKGKLSNESVTAPAKKISQLVKPQVIIGASKIAIKSLKSFAMKPTGSITQNTKPASSLSSSSSSSSLSNSTLAENIKTNGYNRSYKNGISNH